MAAAEVQIAEAVAAEIEAKFTNKTFTYTGGDWKVQWKWLPVLTPVDDQILCVTVLIEPEIEQNAQSSSHEEFIYTLTIDVQKKVADVDDVNEIAEYCRLVEEIHDYYRGQTFTSTGLFKRRLTGLSGVEAMTCTRPVIYDLETLQSEHKFQSRLEAKFRTWR